MLQSISRITSQMLTLRRGQRVLRISFGRTLHSARPRLLFRQHGELSTPFQLPLLPQFTALAKYSNSSIEKNSDSSTEKNSDASTEQYSLIYSLPHIKFLRAVSRLKLMQTGITVILLPPVYYLYLQGDVSYFLVSYTTAIAAFAGLMLYAVSHYLRRVVGMMYLDSSQTTLRVSHLSFWGGRRDTYIPVSDVMTLGDSGDAVGESILRLRRHGDPNTLYFSTRFGRVTDRRGFEKVFGTLG